MASEWAALASVKLCIWPDYLIKSMINSSEKSCIKNYFPQKIQNTIIIPAFQSFHFKYNLSSKENMKRMAGTMIDIAGANCNPK